MRKFSSFEGEVAGREVCNRVDMIDTVKKFDRRRLSTVKSKITIKLPFTAEKTHGGPQELAIFFTSIRVKRRTYATNQKLKR